MLFDGHFSPLSLFLMKESEERNKGTEEEKREQRIKQTKREKRNNDQGKK
jgi:hypothetical protein